MPKTITFTNNGNGTHTLAMEWVAESSKLIDLGADAGQYFYAIHWQQYDSNGAPIPWNSLTNQQKLDVLLKECTSVLRKGAYTQYTDDTVDTAKDGMESESDKYDMED